MLKSYYRISKQKNCSINNQVMYPFFISKEFIDFSESKRISLIFFYVFQNTVCEKNCSYNHATVSSITRKILVCDMESQ